MGIVSFDEFKSTSFDYIVIGGGTTGLVVAARLAEDPNVTVGLLEAGQYVTNEDRIDIPGLFGKSHGVEGFDWNLKTVPQPGAGDRVISIARGKILGGTSAINSMTWSRASRAEYDAISQLSDAPQMKWGDWLKYFKKSETMHGSDPEWSQNFSATFDPELHGTNGPIQKSFVPWLGEPELNTHISFLESMNNLGVTTNHDSCSGTNTGIFTLATAIDPETRKRSYATTAYYEPNAHKANFKVLTGAIAERIVFDEGKNGAATRRAVAVNIVHSDGSSGSASVSRDVIISAGAYLTPTVLERSGVGNPDILKKAGIDTKIDLPGVGENLQDHLLVPSSYELKPPIISSDFLRDPEFAAEQLALYRESRLGQYTSVHSLFSLLPAQAFVDPSVLNNIALGAQPLADEKRTNQHKLHIQWLLDEKQGQVEFMHVPEFSTTASQPKPRTAYMSTLTLLMRPVSRGNVHVQSATALTPPRIDLRYLDNEADLKLLVEAMKFTRKLSETEPLASLIVAPIDPTPDATSDDALAAYIRKNVESAHHPIGTAAMLPLRDGGVVDSDFRVYGTENVRVADASVLPIQISSHPQATLYALGEMIADRLRHH